MHNVTEAVDAPAKLWRIGAKHAPSVLLVSWSVRQELVSVALRAYVVQPCAIDLVSDEPPDDGGVLSTRELHAEPRLCSEHVCRRE